MSWFLLWSSAVLAAAPTARVAGVSGARAVAVVLQRGDTVAGAGCNDAGVAPDAAPDGVFTCGPLPPVDGPVRVGLLRDGKLVDAGDTTLGPAGLALRVDGGTVVLGDASVLGAARPGAPVPAGLTVLARVRGLGDGPAPVVRLQGPGGSTELVCRDDGVFPDAERNDGEPGCAGVAPGPRADVYLNGAGQGSFGTVTWTAGDPFAFLVVDGAAGKARAEAFALPPFAPDVVLSTASVEHTVVPISPPPEGEAPVEPTEPGDPLEAPPPPAPVQPPDPVPTEQAHHSPVATRDLGGLPPLALLVAVGLGAGGGVVWRRRSGRLPATLTPHPAPALLPGGPSLADPAAALVCADPIALVAALLPTLARHRRVVVVAAPDAAIPPVADGPVYRAARPDCEEVESAVRTLARTPGPPVAVLVVGPVLTDPGAVAPAPEKKLRDGLPAGVWLGVVTPEAPAGLPAWRVTGPAWRAERSS